MVSLQFPPVATGFVSHNKVPIKNNKDTTGPLDAAAEPAAASSSSPCQDAPHPFNELPGDPSLVLVTNLDLGAQKLDVMKKVSKLISETTGKPETYVGVSITDNASVIFGGSDAPCALGNLYSIGSISVRNNGMIQSGVTDALEKFGLREDRMYINFWDMPRGNVGWSRRTFAG